MLTAVSAPESVRQRRNTEETLHVERMEMQWADVERFLDELGSRNLAKQAVERYRFCLERLYKFLPEDRCIRRGTVQHWRDQLLESGYAPSTVNVFISACNTWLKYMGRREFQVVGQLDSKIRHRTALKRAEYLQLLVTARSRGEERTFLMVKVFGCTGLYARELPNVTVKAVREGWVAGSENGRERRTRLPDGLREEILSYINRKDIVSGPVFCTRGGTVLSRTSVAGMIRRLGQEAGLTGGKATPSALRLMYLANRSEIEADAALLVEQSMERQAEQEQLVVGWKL